MIDFLRERSDDDSDDDSDDENGGLEIIWMFTILCTILWWWIILGLIWGVEMEVLGENLAARCEIQVLLHPPHIDTTVTGFYQCRIIGIV